MIRKTIYLGAAALVLMGFLFGRDAISYVTTGAGWVKDSVRDTVPVEFEIERARNMLTSLEPEIRNNMHVIAHREVEVERLENQVGKLTSRQHRDRNELVRLKQDIEHGDTVFVYAGRRYTDEQVRADLGQRLSRLKTTDATLSSLTKVLDARKRTLDAARQKLEQMLAAKRQLVVDIQNLEAQHELVNVAQAASEFQFDDSRLSRTKDLVDSIRTRLDVAERMLDVEITLHDQIPLDEDSHADVVEQVAHYINELSPEVAELADLDSSLDR